MHSEKKFNPPHEFIVELLTWAYTNSTIIDLNSEQIASRAKKEEIEIYKNAENILDYYKRFLYYINPIFNLEAKELIETEKLNRNEKSEFMKKKYEEFLKQMNFYCLKADISNTEKKYTKDKKEIQKLEITNLKSNSNEFLKKLDYIPKIHQNISECVKTLGQLINNCISKNKFRSPNSLKQISSYTLMNNAIIFAKFAESIEKNEIPFSIAEQLLENSRNVPSSFKKLIDSKRKESLEKESMTREL